MVVQHALFENIRPTFNENNWRLSGQVKVEIINGKLFSGIDKTHWIYPVLKKEKQFIRPGFYINSEKPHELMRIAGKAPDIWVIGYRVRR